MPTPVLCNNYFKQNAFVEGHKKSEWHTRKHEQFSTTPKKENILFLLDFIAELTRLRENGTRKPRALFNPGITRFSALKSEIAYQKSCEAMTNFPKDNLKHVETVEKNPLPDKDGEIESPWIVPFPLSANLDCPLCLAIAQEAEHIQFKQGIEKFDKEKLSNVETVEKNTLPTKEVIDQEKSAWVMMEDCHSDAANHLHFPCFQDETL